MWKKTTMPVNTKHWHLICSDNSAMHSDLWPAGLEYYWSHLWMFVTETLLGYNLDLCCVLGATRQIIKNFRESAAILSVWWTNPRGRNIVFQCMLAPWGNQCNEVWGCLLKSNEKIRVMWLCQYDTCQQWLPQSWYGLWNAAAVVAWCFNRHDIMSEHTLLAYLAYFKLLKGIKTAL